MTSQYLVDELKSSREFFERSSRCLTEDNSAFSPSEGTYTVAQQVSHVARTIDWFVEGASRKEGFDMNFEQHVQESNAITSLTQSREWLAKAFDGAIEFFGSRTDAQLEEKLPPGPVMGGLRIYEVVGAIVEHNSHHRGALTVYSRLVGKVPLMPYFE